MLKNINKAKRITKIIVAVILSLAILWTIFLFSYTGGVDVVRVVASSVSSGQTEIVDKYGHSSFVFKNDNFKILQLSDIHYGNGWWTKTKDKNALYAVKTLVENTEPDIIIITGDIAYPVPIQTGSRNNLKQLKAFGSFMEGFEIPWTIVFGNHDADTFATNTKKELGDYLETLDWCFYKNNDIGITGLGNNVVDIFDKDKHVSSLFLFDSSSTINNLQFLGYGKVEDDQVEWYENELNKMKIDENFVPSLAFMHIPGREYKTAWDLYKNGSGEIEYHFGTAGENNQKISCSKEQSSLFEKMVELGSTKGIFVGHDHLNDFSLSYKGIRLTFSKSIDYTAYFGIANKTEQRGGTLISLDKSGGFSVEHIKLIDIQ